LSPKKIFRRKKKEFSENRPFSRMITQIEERIEIYSVSGIKSLRVCMASKSASKKQSKKAPAAKKKIAKKLHSLKTKSAISKSNKVKAPKSAPKKLAVEKADRKSGGQKSSTTQIVEPLHPLGKKFTCYNCGTKFYDLNKPEKICPKCGADQMAKPALKSRQAALRASDYEYDEDDPIRKYPEEEEDDAFLDEDEEPSTEVDEDAVEEE